MYCILYFSCCLLCPFKEQNEDYKLLFYVLYRIFYFLADHCWAIAAAECTGALHYMVTGEQLILSPQYILDCVTWQKGIGGKVADAFEHTERYGIALEADWPYQHRPINVSSLQRPINSIWTNQSNPKQLFSLL